MCIRDSATTFFEVEQQISETEATLSGMIDDLEGNEYDMLGLNELKKLLGGSNRDVEILGITTSEGALTPRQGERKVKALLNSLYHQGPGP